MADMWSRNRIRYCRWVVTGITGLLLSGCGQNYTPKPAGYPRFETPAKEYVSCEQAGVPYTFEIPVYSKMQTRPSSADGRQGWSNLYFPAFKGTLHLSYKPVEGNLGALIEDSRNLAYKHTVKADGIEESPFIDRGNRRYGMIYDLSGDVASALQFFVTDSTTHFLRGSLYFNCSPNQDSLRPVVNFIRADVVHMIETTRWKYE